MIVVNFKFSKFPRVCAELGTRLLHIWNYRLTFLSLHIRWIIEVKLFVPGIVVRVEYQVAWALVYPTLLAGNLLHNNMEMKRIFMNMKVNN